MLSKSEIVDRHGQTCTTPTQPWVVFTAGAMGAGKSWVIKQMMKEEVRWTIIVVMGREFELYLLHLLSHTAFLL